MKYFEIPLGKCTTDRQRKHYRDNTTGTTVSSLVITVFSAGRSLGFYLSMFLSEICKQTLNLFDHGVESVNQTEKSNIKL